MVNHIQHINGGILLTNTGADEIFLDASGNVGIGTQTPSEKIHLIGNFAQTGDYTTTGTVTATLFSGAFSGSFSGSSFTLTSGTQGSVVFLGAGGVLSQDNSNLFWDDTTKRLGIGTAIPTESLDVSGNIAVSGTVDGVDLQTLNTSVSTNTSNISTNTAAIALNTTHRTSNGSDHSYLNQSVTTSASPTFASLTVKTTPSGPTNIYFGNSTDTAASNDTTIHLYAADGGGGVDSGSISKYSNNMTINPGAGSLQLASNVQVLSGKTFKVHDTSNADYVSFSHDGTDFNIAATNTTDINITGADLKVVSSASALIQAESTSTSMIPTLSIKDVDNGEWNLEVGRSSLSGLGFYEVGGTTRMFIEAGGNVGIGTTSPSFPLEVVGDIAIKTGNYLRLHNPANSTYASIRLDSTNTVKANFAWSFTDTGTHYIAGSVGIGTTNPTESLDVTGNIAVSGTVDGIDLQTLNTSVSTNTTDISTNASAISLNTTHRTSNGTDHTYIDQDLRTTATPTFANVISSTTFKVANGTAAAPTYSFTSDTDTGVFHSATNTVGLSANGIEVFNSNDIAARFLNISRINFADGTSAAPFLTWFGDNDTGIYRAGANNFGLSCGGSEVLGLSTSGVSITGTTTISSSLTVNARGQFTGNTLPTTGTGMEIGYDGTKGILIAYDRDTSAYKTQRYNALTHEFEISGTTKGGIDATGISWGFTGASYPLHISTTDTQINLTSTSTTSYTELMLNTNGNDWNIGAGGSGVATTDLRNAFYIKDTTGGNYRMVIDSSGNVGLGETAPASSFHITANNAGRLIDLQQDSTTTGNHIRWTSNSVVRGYLGIEDYNGGSLLTGSGAYDMVLRSEDDLWLLTNGNNYALKLDTSQNATFAGDVKTVGNVYKIVPSNITDDNVYSFTPNHTMGIIVINARNNTYSTANAMVNYRTTSNVFTELMAQSGSTVEVTTGILGGTTGTDTKLTISAHTDGKIYIENRMGTTVSIAVTMLGS